MMEIIQPGTPEFDQTVQRVCSDLMGAVSGQRIGRNLMVYREALPPTSRDLPAPPELDELVEDLQTAIREQLTDASIYYRIDVVPKRDRQDPSRIGAYQVVFWRL